MNFPMDSSYLHRCAFISFLFGLLVFLFYHVWSMSLLYHHRFGGQIENGPMDSFSFVDYGVLLVQTFLLYDDYRYQNCC